MKWTVEDTRALRDAIERCRQVQVSTPGSTRWVDDLVYWDGTLVAWVSTRQSDDDHHAPIDWCTVDATLDRLCRAFGNTFARPEEEP